MGAVNDNQDWMTGPVAAGWYWANRSFDEDWDEVDAGVMDGLVSETIQYQPDSDQLTLTPKGELELMETKGNA